MGKDGASPRKALVDIVNMVCPVLKFQFSYLFRCTKCSVMASRISKFYDPGFDTKVFPGRAHPEKGDKENWPTKNFALEAALTDVNLFFGVDFCGDAAEAEATDVVEDNVEDDADMPPAEIVNEVDANAADAQDAADEATTLQ